MHDPTTGLPPRDFMRALSRHVLLLVVLMVVGAGGTWAYCRFIAPRVYESKITLLIKHPSPDSQPTAGEAGSTRSAAAFAQAQRQVLMSDLVLSRAYALTSDPGLRDQWNRLRDARQAAATPDAAAASREHVEQFLKGTLSEKVRSLLSSNQAGFDDFRQSVRMESASAAGQAGNDSFTVVVERPGAAGDADSHQDAMHAANALADMYLLRFEELQRELGGPSRHVMGDAVADYEKYMKQRQGEYEQFLRENAADIGGLEQMLKSGAGSGADVLVSKVRENDARLSLEYSRDKALHEVLMKALPENALKPGGIDEMSYDEMRLAVERTPTDFVQANPGIQEMQKELGRLIARKAQLDAQFTPASREIRNINEEISRTTRGILTQIVAQARSLAVTVEARARQLEMNREMLATNEKQQNEIQRKLMTYSRLKNDYQVAESHLADLRRQQSEAMSASLQDRVITISKLGPASMPDRNRPLSPRTGVNVFIALILSGILGAGLIALLDRFDRSFRSMADVEASLGVPVLGTIKSHGDGLVVSG